MYKSQQIERKCENGESEPLQISVNSVSDKVTHAWWLDWGIIVYK